MSGIQVSIDKKKKNMTIVIPMQKPTPSSSGKTMVIATTHGNQKVDCDYDGKEITIGVNAYFKP